MATSWKVWLSSFHSIGYSFITKLRSKYMRKHLFILHWATTHCLTLYKKRIYPQGEERHHMWRNSTTRCGLIWCCCHVIAFTRLAIIWYRKLPFWSPTPFHHKLLPPPPPHPSYTLGDKCPSKCIEENSITTFWPLIKNQKMQNPLWSTPL